MELNIELEICRYCALKAIRHTLPQIYKVQAALLRLIITEKTFANQNLVNINLNLTDPVIPEFNNDIALEQFKKELLECNLQTIDNIINDIKLVSNKYIEKIKNITNKFNKNNKFNSKNKGKLVCYYSNEHNKYIFEYTKQKKQTFKPKYQNNQSFNNKNNKNVSMFTININKNIYEYLQSKIDVNYSNSYDSCDYTAKNYENSRIFIVWLRYINLSNWDDAYQLRINYDFYKFLKHEFNVNLELMASPINFQFNLYCSLFYDTDKYFGSLGNYVDVIHNSNITGIIYINPPYIELIQNNIVAKILHELNKEDRELGCILFLAYWPDSKSYNQVLNSKYLHKKIIPGNMQENQEKLIFTVVSDQDNKKYNICKKTCMFVLLNDKIYPKYKDKLDKI